MSNDECLLMNDLKNMFYIKRKYFFFKIHLCVLGNITEMKN